MFKTVYKKTDSTYIFGLLLIKQYEKTIFLSKKQLYISKVAIKTLILIIVLVSLLCITRLIGLNYNKNR